MNVGTFSIKCNSFNISFAAITSFLGSSVKDTLIVFPMPKSNIFDKPILDLISPLNEVPASVIPICKG